MDEPLIAIYLEQLPAWLSGSYNGYFNRVIAATLAIGSGNRGFKTLFEFND
jgi:hypothetical protein